MYRSRVSTYWFWVALVALAAANRPRAGAQTGDPALKDLVGKLVERLDSKDDKRISEAEKSLIELGPKALPYLPEDKKSPERDKRLEKIREKLREAQDALSIVASKITLKRQGIRLTEALRELQKQSGNAITDIRDQGDGEGDNPTISLDLKEKPFLEALDEISEHADVQFNFYTGDGSVGLMAGKPPKRKFQSFSGPFRTVLKLVASQRVFEGDDAPADGNIQFELAWEPKVRPMLLALKSEDVKITDDQGKPVEPEINEESNQVVLRPENASAEINVKIRMPERGTKMLGSVVIKAEVTVPAAQKTFKFPNLAKPNQKIAQGDIEVTLNSNEVEEQVWKTNVTVAYKDDKGAAFESYRQGLFNNRIWLQRADGSKFELNGGFNNSSSDGGTISFEYLFVEVPGKPEEYQLVYETPSKVLTVPVEFTFKDVPLP